MWLQGCSVALCSPWLGRQGQTFLVCRGHISWMCSYFLNDFDHLPFGRPSGLLHFPGCSLASWAGPGIPPPARCWDLTGLFPCRPTTST